MKHVWLDEQDMSDHLHRQLLEKGFIATSEECDQIAEIMFDYLVALSVIEEVEEWEENDEF